MKRHLLEPFDEADDVAARPAPEAVVEPRLAAHGKRRDLFRVEGAAAEVVPAPPPQRDAVRTDDRHQVGLPFQRLDRRGGNGHRGGVKGKVPPEIVTQHMLL